MTHRMTDLTYRGLGAPTKLRSDKPRCVAIGCCNGGTFRLMTPPVFALVDEADMIRFAEGEEGYHAFYRGAGPGRGKNRNIGWIRAHRESAAYIEERAEERREQ